MNMGNTLPKTTWRPCPTCSWGVMPFWGLMELQIVWDKLFGHRNIESTIGGKGCNCGFNNLFSMYGVWLSLNTFQCTYTSFTTPTIMGLGYKLSLDFANPLNLTPWHNQYVLVMIKHFSMWLELVPILDCNNENASYAFKNLVFNRIGALAEIHLCDSLIDHCINS
jgi:hypothetical protein